MAGRAAGPHGFLDHSEDLGFYAERRSDWELLGLRMVSFFSLEEFLWLLR